MAYKRWNGPNSSLDTNIYHFRLVYLANSYIMKLTTLLVAAALLTAAHAYIWPNPQLDELESLRYDQYGYNGQGTIPPGLAPCTKAFRNQQSTREVKRSRLDSKRTPTTGVYDLCAYQMNRPTMT
jgi:hypothetical protein